VVILTDAFRSSLSDQSRNMQLPPVPLRTEMWLQEALRRTINTQQNNACV